MKSCLICDSQNIDIYEKNVMKCSDCVSFFRSEPNDSKKHYWNPDEKFSSVNLSKKITNSFTYSLFHDYVAEEYVNYLKEKTSFSFKNSLDIGSNYGNFVKKLHDTDVDAYGVEAAYDFYSLSKLKNKIIHSYFDDTFPTDKKYDLISLTQMIYYSPDPINILKHIKKLLNKVGLIFIATFNPDSSSFKEKRFPIFELSHYNQLISKKGFKALNKIGLDLVDYSSYKPNLFLDTFNKNKLNFLNYVLKFKKPYIPDSDGFHAFVLLKHA